jgi:hypothetical protein
MRTMRHLLALAVCFGTACAPAHVVSTPAPAPAAGDRIRYADRSDTTEFVVARFVALDATKLVFQRYVADSGRTITRSVPTDSVAVLQVRVGRRGNAVRGALIGGLAGVGIGFLCANEPEGWVTDEQCVVGYTLIGAGTGLLIGALVRSDVWAPASLPTRVPGHAPTAQPLVNAAPGGIGVRIPVRLASP